MRKIRAVLRLYFEQGETSQRRIAQLAKTSRDSVATYLIRAKNAGLTWPLPQPYDQDDHMLENLLFPPQEASSRKRPLPDWTEVRDQLQQKGGTLHVLHDEYLEAHPDGLSYSRFCHLFKQYTDSLDLTMRHLHVYGEAVQVDYAGKTVPIHDLSSGVIVHAQIFVGVLAASKYTYAEAQWSQSLPDWIAGHVRMFEHFGGVPRIVICDNLKSGVTKAGRRPVINRTYDDCCEHYQCSVLPADKKRPKHKPHAEGGVNHVTRYLFALRKKIFYSLAELNEAISGLLTRLNSRSFQKLPGSRLSAFEISEKPVLQALPANRYEYAEFSIQTIGKDYRVQLGHCRYTVPQELYRKRVEVRATSSTVEVIHEGRRVASHERAQAGQALMTNEAHMPPNHRHYATWKVEDAWEWGAAIGTAAREMSVNVCQAAKNRDFSYRAHRRLKSLLSEYGAERFEAACARALEIGAPRITSLESILSSKLDLIARPLSDTQEANFSHENIRGSDYYH